MEEEYTIEYVEKPEESAWGIIGRAINAYNRQQAGDHTTQRLCFVLQGPGGEIAGGVVGVFFWNWLAVDLMWVREDLRGRGYGGRLLARIEDLARQHGAQHAYLDTFSFQAPGFYLHRGYHVFGELPGFPPGHTRYYLTKLL